VKMPGSETRYSPIADVSPCSPRLGGRIAPPRWNHPSFDPNHASPRPRSMKVINITDSRKRNTRVALETRRPKAGYQFRDQQRAPVTSVRVVKGSVETSLGRLAAGTSLEDLSRRLIEGDAEIDLELFGKRITDSSRIFLDSNDQPAHNVVAKELVFSAEQELKETRDLRVRESNINSELPLKWSGKLLPKAEIARKMAFVHCYRITHVDGLTYDFLYEMAKELEAKQALLVLSAGPKMNEPLVLTRNGMPYRGFLEGRTRDDKYLLLLHLTNLELKPVMEGPP